MHKVLVGTLYQAASDGPLLCFCGFIEYDKKHDSLSENRFAIVATVALTTGILGAQGTTKRQASMTMSWQIKQPIGVPNSNAWTAYELPREVSLYCRISDYSGG